MSRGRGMGEAGGHRHLRQPFRSPVRARDRAAALHASATDAAKLRGDRGWFATRFTSRFRRALALPGRRRLWVACIQPRRWDCLPTRPNRWIPSGLSPRGLRCRLDLRAYSQHSSHRFGWAALSALAAELVLFAGGLSWLAVLTHSVSLAIAMASTGLFLRKSSKCCWPPLSPHAGNNGFRHNA